MSKILKITSIPENLIGRVTIRGGKVSNFKDAVGLLTLILQAAKHMSEDTTVIYERFELSSLTEPERDLLKEIFNALMSTHLEDLEIRSDISF